MVDRLARLDFDDPFEAFATILGRKDEIGKHLANPDLDPCQLLVADVDGDVVPSLQSGLQHADDPVVLQLFANRSHQDGTHGASYGK